MCSAKFKTIPHNRVNPNAGKKADTFYQELKKLHRSRIQRIFEAAVANKAEVLILGAFGCGAFRNPRKLVAEVFSKISQKNIVDVLMSLSMRFIIQNAKQQIMRRLGMLWGGFCR